MQKSNRQTGQTGRRERKKKGEDSRYDGNAFNNNNEKFLFSLSDLVICRLMFILKNEATGNGFHYPAQSLSRDISVAFQ